ncbi:class I SAM-dependent methyltransferase [Mucilaginibacter sp. HMF5004]|uniref:class I SAM-dependent methyltransferase n=1 Tax=Mucilaginibacter rivuli TaxID=2857527 RepID=UPI001C6071D6|nr:class I SAM-dependent methyltransferase [Mucilaginibacter rivuli]MBW4890263.1 class I SAM-dependent methyltransferase [Mucilaginibacter rivuli]
MASNYDNSASFYDALSRLTFGKTLIRSQVYLLPFIPEKAKVLIVGGGTGWILEEIAKVHPTGLDITYVEISAKMAALSQKRNAGNNSVSFVNNPIEEVALSTDYDVIFTPFLFDNFTDETLPGVFYHIHRSLKSQGLWLCADFQITGKLWQKALLKSMYFFFKLLCGIDTTTLPDIEAQFTKHNYKKKSAKTFFADFIISTQHQKS